MTEINGLKKMKVVGYVRVSTTIQAELGEGLNTQRLLIKEKAKKEGWTLLHIYSDEGISGSKSENRPDFQNLLNDTKNKKFDAVVISRLSRFGRNARELHNNIEILKQSGVAIISIKENFDLSHAYGRAMFGMLASIVELERDVITEQMSESKKIKWYQNRMSNGRPPYGYQWKKETETMGVNNEEKEIYERIVDLYLNHGLSLKDISIKLKEEGIISKKKPFNSATLSYILKNPAYCNNYFVNQYKYKDGKRLKEKKDKSEYISFKMEPFISIEKWEKIQEKTKFNKSKGKRITRANNLILRDMLYCGYCGGRVKPRFGSKNKKGNIPSYYCCYWAQTS